MTTELQVLQESQGFSVEQQKMLDEKLKEHDIKERKGTGGKMLKYISGDYAISTANRIFGFGKWGYRVLSKAREQVGDEEFYTADIELYVIGCPFPFPGEGVGTVKRAQGAAYATVEQHEKARKEAVTDALKRALRHYGDQFGLSLYNEDNYVEDDDGNPVKVKDVGKPHSNGMKPTPKVVDSVPETPTIKELQKRCNTICGIGFWQTMILKALKVENMDIVLKDSDLTPDDRLKIKEYLDFAEQRKLASAGAGK